MHYKIQDQEEHQQNVKFVNKEVKILKMLNKIHLNQQYKIKYKN
jgi:hypothetical protein